MRDGSMALRLPASPGGARAGALALALACACAGGEEFGSECSGFGCPQESEGEGEACDGRDDDGDGWVDRMSDGSPLVRACETACGRGQQVCVDAAWQPCTARAPRAETCDAVDNDCDGMTDEDCGCVEGQTRACGDDVGACSSGVQRCAGGVWSECEGAGAAGDEICDGADNDCDGEVDETCTCDPGEEQACGADVGACRAGVQRCADGVWGECEGGVPGTSEVCDGLDNDCDGTADELWSEDEFEDNDVAEQATVRPNVDENGDPAVLFATLAPSGDADWYRVRGQEGSDACVPLLGEDDYRMVLALVLPDGADPARWRMCVREADRPAPMTWCTQGVDFFPEQDAYILGLCWDGRCGSDDSKTFLVEVRADEDHPESCGNYALYAEFTQPGVGCP